MDPITPFGRKWEYRHSMWMNWLFGPFLLTGFISFIYIGIRAKKKKWLFYGAIYFIIMAQYFFYFSSYDINSTTFDISIMLVLGGWVFAWVHAFQARREYLRILAVKIMKDPLQPTPPYRVKTHYPFPTEEQPFTTIKNVKKVKADLPVVDKKVPFTFNVNNASLQEIASHPYIGNILARQIVQIRERVGAFQSLEHLIEETNMKPHIIAKAKPYITFGNVEKQTPTSAEPSNDEEQNKPNASPSRKKETISGRIVDY
ncbi:helix-hairpin-helix domain-containing protein [Sutcliffiella cohnii]